MGRVQGRLRKTTSKIEIEIEDISFRRLSSKSRLSASHPPSAVLEGQPDEQPKWRGGGGPQPFLPRIGGFHPLSPAKSPGQCDDNTMDLASVS